MSDWDARYAEPGHAYGTEPNGFLAEVAHRLPRGRALCLADGQGRNGVYLATLGHDVVSMDQSGVGLERARTLATERGVRIATVQADLAEFVIEPAAWDAIVSIFVHLPSVLRARVARATVAGLKPGGAFVLEAYTPAQIGAGTGGPSDPDRLASLATLMDEYAGLEWRIARELEREVVEGRMHTGRASVVQLLGMQPS
jgi:SAM-dependent methyltransferase